MTYLFFQQKTANQTQPAQIAFDSDRLNWTKELHYIEHVINLQYMASQLSVNCWMIKFKQCCNVIIPEIIRTRKLIIC
jgi:hypothetical protein